MSGPIRIMEADEEEVAQDMAGRAMPLQRSPVLPSREEVEEHNRTHLPYRSWCAHCVRGWGESRSHRNLKAASERSVPHVVMDYCFMGQEGEETTMPILAIKDTKTRRLFSIPVPCKGVSQEYPIRQLNNCICLLGHSKIVLKSDGEPAIVALAEAVKAKAKQVDIHLEQSITGDSASNGEIENANKLIQNQIRTMFDALKLRYKVEIPSDHPILKWLILHAGALLTRFMVGNDGKTAFERERGKKYRRSLPEFGETVHYMPLRRKESKRNKLDPRLKDGIFLGIREANDEMFIGTELGVVRTNTIYRRPEIERWNGEFMLKITGVPWKPIPSLPSASEPAIAIPVLEDEGREVKDQQAAVPKQIIPRKIYLRVTDFDKHGFTPGCRGCESIITKAKYRINHSDECRARILVELAKEESGQQRLAEADMRENLFMERDHERLEAQRSKDVEMSTADSAREAGGGGSSSSSSGPAMDLSSIIAVVEDIERREADHQRRSLLCFLGAIGVSEVYSPPRVTARAQFHGIEGGVALDLTVNDEKGIPWDFSIPERRAAARKLLAETKPYLLIGSPPCTPFSKLQNLNFPKMDPKVVEEMLRQGREHLEFCCTLYRDQLKAGNHFLHEHPDGASSWQEECMRQLMADSRVMHVKGNMCAQGMVSRDWEGEGLVMKTTGYLTSSEEIANEVQAKCTNKDGVPSQFSQFDLNAKTLAVPRGTDAKWSQVTRRMSYDAETGAVIQDLKQPQVATMEEVFADVPRGVRVLHTVFYYRHGGTPWHRHVHLMGGRAKAAQVYPQGLVDSILRGLKKQMEKSGMINALEVGPVNEEPERDWEAEYPDIYDQVSGKLLDPVMIKEARATELGYVHNYGVYKKVPVAVCWERTGKAPIRVKWVDINKGDEEHPDYRSRLVAMEIRPKWQAAAFAGTPPLEAMRFLLSLARTHGERNQKEKPLKLSFIDIRRAHFTAKASREIYVDLVEEDQDDPNVKQCGLLLKSMYGTQDAAQNWEQEYSDFLVSIGFLQGLGSPCLFYHPVRNIRVNVHGDDFTNLGTHEQLLWLRDKFLERYEIKDSGIMGPDPDDIKQVRVLNRLVTWHSDRLEYEADPRHAEIIIAELALQSAKPVSTPGGRDNKEKEGADGDSPALDQRKMFQYRSLVMRAQYLSLDRRDIQFATKELARKMQAPTERDWQALKKLGRYLLGKPRLVWEYRDQQEVREFTHFTDSDDAGCPITRKSTSSGDLLHGDHLLKSYSSTQQTLALSSGESEFYATIKAASSALGAKAMAADLGVELGVNVATDASASKAMVSRRGFGKVKHISRCFLWIQQRIREKEMRVSKVGTNDNPADIGTKFLEFPKIQHLLRLLSLKWAEGSHSMKLKAAL